MTAELMISSFPTPRGGDGWAVADLDQFPESTLIEVLDGALIVNPPPLNEHRMIQGEAYAWLREMHLAPDVIALVEPAIMFSGDNGVIADAGLVHGPLARSSWTDPADVIIVIEVLSPSTRDRDLGRKRELYHAADITYVIIDPVEHTITVHDDPRDLDIDALAELLGWAAG